ncbi:flagellar hook protein FlgE [Acetonema longum]|uniref:Flagellar hook protein FlgE n=1 Tax=Acetonema longum DSM 6540 TaxID=1009370 RepID=F7NL50_9FIRM|nr:flagellar hook protein FlgE [Acetonema longum]EGO63155.1 flagellar hook-basal body protein [Acetonema longum DSM 6540]
MMRSLFSGVSGLRNHQTRMDVIGNNIANVNTIGYKAGRANFQDVLSQTLSGASSASATRGGTNPKQVGLGMGLASIDTIFTDGSFQPTGKQSDLSIQGQGFFILANGSVTNRVYSRAGNFDFDEYGNYVVPGTGLQVMGWMADANGVLNTNDDITTIKIPVGGTMAARATTSITFEHNLSGEVEALTAANAADPDYAHPSRYKASIPVYDGQGSAHKVSGTFEKVNSNQWLFTPDATTDTGSTVAPVLGNSVLLTFDAANGAFVSAVPYNAGTPHPIDDGGSTAGAATDPFEITIDPDDAAGYGAATFTATLDFSALTQRGGESTAQALEQDGYPAGELDRITIDTSGVIQGNFTNGEFQTLARVALATFNNPAGLTKAGSSLYSESNNSGVAQIGTTKTGGRGELSPGTLEMSNVDLAEEFSNMVITQRGFQANSRIITTTDEMLQELANLKR